MLKLGKLLRKPAVLFGALLLYLYFRGIGDHGLIDPVEGINASIGIHMSAGGNLFVPRIGDSLAAGKNLLTWWLSALALRVFGWGEFAVRFWSALAGLGMAAASVLAAKTDSPRSSWLAAGICAGMTGSFVVSQVASSHALYSCLTGFAMAGAVRSRENKYWLIFSHFCSSLAFMAHGSSGLFLVWLSVIAYCVISEDWEMLTDFFTWPPGMILTVIVSGFYLVIVIIANPEIVHFMRCQNHIYTFGGLSGAVIFLFLCFVPWHGFIARAVFEVLPKKYPAEKGSELFMLVWAAMFAFSGAVSGDVMSVAACIPALSAILGRKLDAWLLRKNLYSVRMSVMINVLVLVPVLYMFLPFTMRAFPAVRVSLMSLIPWGGAVALCLFAGWYYTKTKQIVKWVRNVPAAALLCLMPLAGVFNLTAEEYSVREVGQGLRSIIQGNDTVIQYGVNFPSVYFYTLRNSRIIDAELMRGVQERKFLADFSLIGRLWDGQGRVFLIMPSEIHTDNPLPGRITHILESYGILLLSNK